MIIEKIEIESFAAQKNTVYEFSGKIDLVEGDNESGKSSIADFIKFILYGVSGKGVDSHLSERKRVMNFNESHIAGSMNVESGGRHLRISRNLAVSGTVRESVRTRISVVDIESGEDLYDGREPGEIILGIPESVFTASAYLSQRSEHAVKGESLHEAVSNILFSGDERISAQKAIEKIEGARKPLLHKNANKGRIPEIKAEIAECSERLMLDMQTNNKLFVLDSEIAQRKKTNADHAQRISYFEKKRKAYDNARLIEAYEAKSGAERDKVAAEMSMLEHKAEAHIPTDSEIEELWTYDNSMRSLGQRLSECKAQKAAHELECEKLSGALSLRPVIEKEGLGIADRVDSYIGKAKKLLSFGIIIALLCVACAAASFFVKSIATALYIACAVCAAVGALLIALSVSNGAKGKAILKLAGCSDPDGLYDAVDRYEFAKERTAVLKEKIKAADIQLSEGDELVESERARFAEFLVFMDADEYKDPFSEIKKIAQTLTARQKKAVELESAYKTALAKYEALCLQTENIDIERIRAELTECGIEAPLDCDRTKLESNIKFYRVQYETQSEEIHRLELERTALRAKTTAPSELKERISALETELAECERKHAAYVLAAEALTTASEELRRSVAPTLARISGAYMDTLTDGEHTALCVDPSFTLSYEQNGEKRHIDHMSTGTSDMAYLAMRLALGDVISGEGGVVTILDEASAHLDDGRAKNLIKLLARRSEEGHQHILFTCHRREAELMSELGIPFNHIKL